MAVVLKRAGGTMIFSMDAEVKAKDGILRVSLVETQRLPDGNLNGFMQISLNGKPLVIATSSVKPKNGKCSCKSTMKTDSCGCHLKRKTKPCHCKSKHSRQRFRVFDSKKLNELSQSLVLVFGRMRKELAAFNKQKSRTLTLPCWIRIPLCRATYSQYIIACRLRGRPAVDCLREAEAIYNNCKRNC